MSVDPVVSILWDVLKRVAVPIKRRFGYVISSKSYAQDLQKEVGKLADEADRIHIAVEGARTIHRDISPWVPEFMASAEEASKEAKDLLREFHGASKSCCRGTIPDPKCRYQFSRKAKSKTDDIQKLILGNSGKEISFIGPVAYAADLRKEVGNLDSEDQRVRNAAEEARTNLHDIHEWVPGFLASADEALKEAKDLLGRIEAVSNSCRYGTIPDRNCRSQFIGEAKSKTDDIKKIILGNSGKDISFKGPEACAVDLRHEVRNLDDEVLRVRSDEEAARNNLHNICAWVPQFLAKAEKALKEAGDLLGEFEQESKTCCGGTLPDPNFRYQFSMKAKHKTAEMKSLIRESSNKEISFGGPAPGNVAPPTPERTEGKEFYESRETMVRSIMDALASTSNSVVGIYGMGGVGKSTLLLDAEKRIRAKKIV